MEFSGTLSRLTTQLAALRKEQCEALDHALYFGWTSETIADHDRRADLIALILRRLTNPMEISIRPGAYGTQQGETRIPKG